MSKKKQVNFEGTLSSERSEKREKKARRSYKELEQLKASEE